MWLSAFVSVSTVFKRNTSIERSLKSRCTHKVTKTHVFDLVHVFTKLLAVLRDECVAMEANRPACFERYERGPRQLRAGLCAS